MKIEIVNKYKDFLKLHDRWNMLLESSCYDTVFLTHEWFSSFIKAFDLEEKLCITLSYNNAELIGILPLYKERVKYNLLNFNALKSITNVHTPKYSFIMKSGFERSFYGALTILRQKFQWDSININYISENSFFFKNLKLNHKTNFGIKTIPIIASPRITIDQDWNTYYNELFSKSLRKNIEYSLRRAEKVYKVTFEIIEKNKLTNDDLQDAFRIEDSGWKGRNGSSIIRNRNFKEFYERLSFECDRFGWFSLFFLRFDNERVAFDYCLKYKNHFNLLKTGFNEKFYKMAPGHIIRKFAIRHAFENGYLVYDLLGKSDRYKLKMSNDIDSLHSVYFFNKKFKSRALKFFMFDASEATEKIGIKNSLKKVYSKFRDFKNVKKN